MRETERLSLPVDRLVLAASGASAGKRLYLYGKARKVEELSPDVFDGVDFALFSAGREISREYVPIAVKREYGWWITAVFQNERGCAAGRSGNKLFGRRRKSRYRQSQLQYDYRDTGVERS